MFLESNRVVVRSHVSLGVILLPALASFLQAQLVASEVSSVGEVLTRLWGPSNLSGVNHRVALDLQTRAQSGCLVTPVLVQAVRQNAILSQTLLLGAQFLFIDGDSGSFGANGLRTSMLLRPGISEAFRAGNAWHHRVRVVV